MNLHDFFKDLNYTLSEDTKKYVDSLNEVNLKLLVKRIYESNDLVRTELNKQIKLTNFKNVQELVSSLNRDETSKFVYWMAENIFASGQIIEEELEKILVK